VTLTWCGLAAGRAALTRSAGTGAAVRAARRLLALLLLCLLALLFHLLLALLFHLLPVPSLLHLLLALLLCLLLALLLCLLLAPLLLCLLLALLLCLRTTLFLHLRTGLLWLRRCPWLCLLPRSSGSCLLLLLRRASCLSSLTGRNWPFGSPRPYTPRPFLLLPRAWARFRSRKPDRRRFLSRSFPFLYLPLLELDLLSRLGNLIRIHQLCRDRRPRRPSRTIRHCTGIDLADILCNRIGIHP
jgi:hypothetical protein